MAGHGAGAAVGGDGVAEKGAADRLRVRPSPEPNMAGVSGTETRARVRAAAPGEVGVESGAGIAKWSAESEQERDGEAKFLGGDAESGEGEELRQQPARE